MNSAEEFSKIMFGEEFRTKVSIEKVDMNSSYIGVYKIFYFYRYIFIFIINL